MFDRFLRSYAETDVTSRFLANFRSGYTYLELDTTLGAHLGIVCRPGMASASPIGRLQTKNETKNTNLLMEPIFREKPLLCIAK